MKTISFRAVSTFVLNSVMVLGLILAAGFAGVGIAAFFAFHELGVNFNSLRASQATGRTGQPVPRLVSVPRLDRWQGEAIPMDVKASLAANRFVAMNSSDQPHFTYADYQQETPAQTRKIASADTTMIPPALDPVAAQPVAQADDDAPVHLSDPGSRYIMDDRGRIVGIDGTAGALAEARQRQQAAALAASRPHEVRAALPVDAAPDGDLPPPKPDKYPAVRRAMPVGDDADVDAGSVAQLQPFNAASEIADDSRPVRRAEPVVVTPRVRTQPRWFGLP